MDFLNKFDKQQVQKITLIVIAALTILALVLLLVIVIASVNPANSFGMADGFSNVVDYTVTEKDMQTGSLVLADDNHRYNYTFSADELDVIGTYRNDRVAKDENGKLIDGYYMNSQTQMKLTKDAMAAAHNMLVDAEKAVKKDDILLMYSDGLKEKYPLFENMIKDRIYGYNLCGWLEKMMKKNLEDQKDDVSILVIKFVDIS